VLEEARVLGCEDRVAHHRGHVGQPHDAAPLLAELADQHAVGGVDPQRDPGPVVDERVERRQPVVGQQGGQDAGERQQQRAGHRHGNQDGEAAGPGQAPARLRAAIGHRGRARIGVTAARAGAWTGSRL
jgi:hypothetical protein